MEFGTKLDISVVDGWTRLDYFPFDAYNEVGNLPAIAERFRERDGHYPSRILSDKIYRNQENLRFCRECGLGLVTAKLREIAAHVLAMSVLVLNLRKIQRTPLRLFALLVRWLGAPEKSAFIQWTLFNTIHNMHTLITNRIINRYGTVLSL